MLNRLVSASARLARSEAAQPMRFVALGGQRLKTLYAQFKEPYNRHRNVVLLDGVRRPVVSHDAWVAPSATVVGNVVVNDRTNIWYNAVVRGDSGPIYIGAFTNVQDGVVIRASNKRRADGSAAPMFIGDYVTIGHDAMLHGCTLRNHSFVGMGTVIMEGAVVNTHAMVAAGAVIMPGTHIPEGQLWAGNPGRYMRDLTYDEILFITKSAEEYWGLSKQHAELTELQGTAYTEVEDIRRRLGEPLFVQPSETQISRPDAE